MIAKGLGRVSYNPSMTGTLKGSDTSNADEWEESGWQVHVSSPIFGKGQHIFEPSPEEQAPTTKFGMVAAINDCACSYNGKTWLTAVGVLLYAFLL